MKQSPKFILVSTACALALGLAVIAPPETALAQISVSITLAPPALPVYEQPVLVDEGSIWTPGYWDYNDGGYFWVPGTWVQPPSAGLLWTPGYWGFANGGYAWNAGYWGATIGFYGGINYGFGYFGHGYEGGHWQGDHFFYNTAVSHVNVTNIHNTYTQTTVNNTTINRVSFNGGNGGVTARPTAAEQEAARAPHQPATAVQVQHRQAAMADRSQSAAVNHGKPPITATAKPGMPASNEHASEKAPMATAKPAETGSPRGARPGMTGSEDRGTQKAPGATGAERAPMHAADMPAISHQPAASTGDAEKDKENQRQQDELSDRQEKQRQDLQQKQAEDHARAAKQPAANNNNEALERQHQAQTQALAQQHAREQKALRDTQQNKPAEKRDPPRNEKQH